MNNKARAKTYAKAYLNVFGAGLSPQAISAFSDAATFLNEHRRALFLLRVPVMPEAVKKDGIKELCNRFQLPSESVGQLFELLLHRKQAGLLAQVLQEIVAVQHERANHHPITVTSSTALSDDEKKTIIQFADQTFPGTHSYTFEVDASLIAGIQIKSDTMMWESSIDNYLRECTQAQIW